MGSRSQGFLSLISLSLHHGGRHIAEKADLMLVVFVSVVVSHSSSENISVLLLWEVDIIESVWMWVLYWVVSVILPGGVGSHVLWMSVAPVLDFEVGHGSSLVVVGNGHGSLVGLVINSLGSQVPLSLLSESFENVIWANFHDRDFFISTLLRTLVLSAGLILSNFSVTSSWNFTWLQSEVLGLDSVQLALSSVLSTKGFGLSIWVPVVMCLVMSMILLEGIVQVTVDPRSLWHGREVPWHGGILSYFIIVVHSKWVQRLIQVGMSNLVSKVVVWLSLMPEVLRGIG